MLDAYDLPEGPPWTADVCIVGAGAAGISMALELAGSGLDVLVLEAGGKAPDPRAQALYEGTVADERLHSPPDRYRQRRFGGTTTIWGGRCMPFDALDFNARPQIPFSGWPIGLDALMPYYPKANRLCEAGEFAYTSETAFDHALHPMIDGFTSSHFTTDTLERFSCPTDFGARYAHKLGAAPNVRVVLHAVVTALNEAPSGRSIESLTVRTLNGRTFDVRAHRVVLATGGLEVARLLLASRVGNAHDVVGRYYMCHIAGTIGSIAFEGPSDRIWHGYDIADDGVYCRRRIALTPATQETEGLANFVARLHHPRITDPAHRTGMLSLLNLARTFIPYEYGKRLHGEEETSALTWLAHVRNVVLDPFATLGFLWNWLRKRTLAHRKFPSVIIHPKASRYSLDFHAEQRPNPDSRVTLGGDRDALGMPRIHIDWRYSAGDVDTVTRTLALLRDDIAASGVGRFDYDPATVEREMTRYGAYGGHHLGTARMGDDPRTSVVDADCKVHGVDNLYIASSAVFATSSQANPTLTIVAIALRVADHLSRLAAHPAASMSGTEPAAAKPADLMAEAR